MIHLAVVYILAPIAVRRKYLAQAIQGVIWFSSHRKFLRLTLVCSFSWYHSGFGIGAMFCCLKFRDIKKDAQDQGTMGGERNRRLSWLFLGHW